MGTPRTDSQICHPMTPPPHPAPRAHFLGATFCSGDAAPMMLLDPPILLPWINFMTGLVYGVMVQTVLTDAKRH